MENINHRRSEQIWYLIKRLSHLGRRLSVIGLTLVSITIVNIIISLLFLLYIVNPSSINVFELLMLITPTFGFALFAPIFFDSSRKTGDTIYDEVIEEIGEFNKSDVYFEESEFFLKARIDLKNYSKQSDLPLFPGKLGPAFFFLLNLTLLILSVLYYVKF